MACEICGRSSCTRSFHSLEAQREFDERQEMSSDVEDLRLELQGARVELKAIHEEINATKEGKCGHNWDRRIWEEGCPTCAMKGGVAVRIGDLEMKNARLRRLLHAYREKRLVDGLNGRTWDAIAHLEAEHLVAECEAALSGEEVDDG